MARTSRGRAQGVPGEEGDQLDDLPTEPGLISGYAPEMISLAASPLSGWQFRSCRFAV
jgi:hypothetical protein